MNQQIERADATTSAARAAIKAIPVSLFGEREAAALIEALQERISASNWKHMEHAEIVGESLTDAHRVCEDVAEAIEVSA